ncbi:hypothetical protein F0562_005600 [Nyssa sinensis]|uniref:Cytochrome P450 n=1 Tax=Nyssa sinensis TaxID=561372 RepID=A0A5J5APC4_9ASTE|nr:hypothetical protein F0562_005600 [Nyssa sinensis]
MASLGFFEVFFAIICFFLWILGDINGLPWNWPLFGMLPSLLIRIHRIHDLCTDVLTRTGGTLLLKGPWFANMDMLGTVDPANVHYIMSANFTNFPKGPDFLKIFDILGDGIFNSDSELWSNQRKLARALINHQRFQCFLVKTSRDKVANGLIPVLEHVAKQGLVVDLQDFFQRLAFDTTCMLVTGYDPGCLSLELPDVPFSKAMDDAEEALVFCHVLPESIWKFQRWLGIGHEKRLSKAWATLDDTIAKYIGMKREEISKGTKLEEEDEEGADLLTSYINEDESLGLKCDDKFLRDTILSFMIVGRDTTSSALTWLFPPVPFQQKEPLQPDILPSGHLVHPKMKIFFSLYAMGRMKSVWGEDCLEFKPERWISERGTIKHEPSYKFLAFNAGPRTCLGKGVAFTQMKAVAATIIHNYQVQVVEGHPVAPNVSIILYMKHGFMVKVTKRSGP